MSLVIGLLSILKSSSIASLSSCTRSLMIGQLSSHLMRAGSDIDVSEVFMATISAPGDHCDAHDCMLDRLVFPRSLRHMRRSIQPSTYIMSGRWPILRSEKIESILRSTVNGIMRHISSPPLREDTCNVSNGSE